ncbi:MAG TPA: type II toxin-antitoxin system ParD family antitoxin [Candidatus Acidoferrum sp.]
MNVSLTPELEHWVDEKVRTGRYASASEVIREALRLLEQQELARQRRLVQVREKIDRALEQLEQGKALDLEDARARLRAARKKK